MGSGMVYTRSFKLRIVTLSSTESEWVVLCEVTTLAEWIKAMLQAFGIKLEHVIMDQSRTILRLWILRLMVQILLGQSTY